MLKGFKLLDLSRIIVGPYATMILSDFGIEVIKVEAIEGDATREWGPPWHEGTSAYFHSVNRNKRSITLNLKNDSQREVVYRLAEKSDAVVENFVPGVTEKLKIDYETLKKYREDLVYCSISGYGDIGPSKNLPAFDNIIQAESGFMHLTGSPSTEPFKMGFAISDVLTGLYAANAVLAGLLQRTQTKKGLHIKTSLIECAMASLINQGSNFLNGKVDPQRMGNHHPNIVPYGLYKTKDSEVIICVGTPQQYHHLIESLGLENQEKFSTNKQRVENREEFNLFLNEALNKMETSSVLSILHKANVPAGKVNSIKEALQSPISTSLDLVQETNNVKYIRSPIRYEGEKPVPLAPPKLGEHSIEILKELGYSEKEMEKLIN